MELLEVAWVEDKGLKWSSQPACLTLDGYNYDDLARKAMDWTMINWANWFLGKQKEDEKKLPRVTIESSQSHLKEEQFPFLDLSSHVRNYQLWRPNKKLLFPHFELYLRNL